MQPICVCLLGKMSIRRRDTEVQGIGAGKLAELLAYLLLYHNRPHPRDVLANLCWGGVPTQQSRKQLRQALWQLQSALQANSSGGPPLLLVDDGWVQVNPAASYWLDVDEFERRVQEGRALCAAKPEGESPVGVRSLLAAVDLYKGDLLEGCYADWCLFERERLQNQYLMLLDTLTGWCVGHREYQRGLDYAGRILHVDNAYEGAHYQIMRLHALSGNRALALRQYEHCVQAMKAELDVRPSRATRALYKQIRAEALPSSGEAPAEANSREPEIADRVKRLRSLLLDFYAQASAQLESIEQTIKEGHP